MWLIREELDWLQGHAVRGQDKTWRCKRTKAAITMDPIGRSIWLFEMSGGDGEVRTVMHLHCPACQEPQATLPRHGAPIQEDELVERSPVPA